MFYVVSLKISLKYVKVLDVDYSLKSIYKAKKNDFEHLWKSLFNEKATINVFDFIILE